MRITVHRLAAAAASLAVLCLTACVATPSVAPDAAPPGGYALDPSHASLIWRVSHGEGLSIYTARFDAFSATLDFDPANPAAARLDVTIDPASVSTGDALFDDQVARVVFDAADHPEIRFVSTAVEQTEGTSATVTGDLTLKGVTLPLTLAVTYNGGAYDPLRGADVIGFSATGRVDRSLWGADAYVNFGVAPEVDLLIEAEFLKQ